MIDSKYNIDLGNPEFARGLRLVFSAIYGHDDRFTSRPFMLTSRAHLNPWSDDHTTIRATHRRR